MIGRLKKFLTRPHGTIVDPVPVCLWAGEHSGDPICFLGIERECGHIETGQPACLAHVQHLLRTGGVAVRPAPCFREDCDVVSFARVAFTTDIPDRQFS